MGKSDRGRSAMDPRRHRIGWRSCRRVRSRRSHQRRPRTTARGGQRLRGRYPRPVLRRTVARRPDAQRTARILQSRHTRFGRANCRPACGRRRSFGGARHRLPRGDSPGPSGHLEPPGPSDDGVAAAHRPAECWQYRPFRPLPVHRQWRLRGPEQGPDRYVSC